MPFPRAPISLPRALISGVVAVLWLIPSAQAQAPARPPAVEAVRTQTPPVVDGILDDAVWENALIIDDFTMQLPEEGIPASERTVVRILYDDDHLYLGVRLYDSQPEKVRASALSRDSFETTSGEQFAWAIDSTDSGRDGFWFSSNPGGAQIDSQVFNEGADLRPRVGRYLGQRRAYRR